MHVLWQPLVSHFHQEAGLAFMGDVFLTPHTWEMASHILSLFNNIRLLEPIIGASLTKEFQKFLEEKYQLNSDYHQARTF